MEQKLKLSKPIRAHDEEVAELTFREPSVNDIVECGIPVTFYINTEDNGAGVQEVKYNLQAATKMIVKLTGIPRSSVMQMARGDFMEAVGIVSSFFGQEVEGAK